MAQLAGVAVVLILLAGALWWLRRSGLAWPGGATSAGTGRRLVERVGRLTLGPHHRLELVRLADRLLVIGIGAQGCSLLETLDWNKLAPPAEERAGEARR